MIEDSLLPFSFPAVGRKKITAAFDGGRITSDAGVMLLGQAERRLGLADILAAVIADPRNPLLITHSLDSIFRASILAIACGYEDADDLDHLRKDPAFRREARERVSRRPPELWNRLNLSRAKPGDRFETRGNDPDRAQNNVTAIDASPGKLSADRRPVAQDRWRARAEKFRAADRKAAARDADLVAAQSQLAIIEKALERAFPRDPQAREKILDTVRERIAQHLEQGRSFERAIVKEQVSEDNRSRTERGEARRNPEEVRERTRQRER